MVAAVRRIWALFFGIALLMLGNGLQGSLLGLRAGIEGFDSGVIGAVMAGFYAGFLLGSMLTPIMVGRVGHIRVFAALASLASTSALLFVVFVDPAFWFAMRVLSGFCLAGLYVVAESWLNHNATNETRGQLLSLYMIVLFAFMGFGQFLLNVSAPGGFVLFILVSALISVSLVPISLTRAAAPVIDRPQPVAIADLYRTSPLGVMASFGCGVAQGAYFAMTPVYAAQVGLSVPQISLLVSFGFFGVVLSQYPIGLLSDRIQRRFVMIGLAGLATLVSLVCLWAAGYSFLVLTAFFTLFGALSLPLYSLAIAHTNDHLQLDQMVAAGARLVLVYGFGSVFGPVLVGLAMDVTGPHAFFVYMAIVHAAIGLYAAYRCTRTEAVPQEEKGEFVFVAHRATPVAAATAIVETMEEYGNVEHAGTEPAPRSG